MQPNAPPLTASPPAGLGRGSLARASSGLLAGVALAVGVIYLATLAPGLTWANASADSGDLVTAAVTGGVAHPTGYPVYLMLARLALLLPIGGPALRTNLLSAVCAALAAGGLALLTARSHPGPRRARLAGGLLAGVAFGLAPLLWSQAVVTEVHALHALFLTLILLTMPLAQPAARPSPRQNVLAGLVFGLALGNHVTAALLLPPWLLASGWQAGRAQWGALAQRLGGLAVGLLAYLYLPWRAAAQPPVNWGNAVTLEGLWWLVSGAPYRAMAFGLPAGFVLGRVQGWASLLLSQFGLLGLVAALFGLFFGRGAGPRVKAVTGWMAAIFSIFAIGYNTADSYAYLLPAFMAFAVWLGLGTATALESLAGWRSHRPLRLGLAGVVAGSLLFNAAAQWPAVDARAAGEAEAFARAALRAAPAGALVFTHADRDTFALWYYHFALRQRPDLAIVVEPLLAFDWYRDNLRAQYPDLALPAGNGAWRADLVAANNRPVCDADLTAWEPAETGPAAAGAPDRPALVCAEAR